MKANRLGMLVAVLGMVMVVGSARALTFDLNTTFAGTYVGDWLTLTLTDDGAGVLLTMQADMDSSFVGGGAGAEKEKGGGVALNFDPAKVTLLDSMNYTVVSKSVGTPDPTGFKHSTDVEKMGGDGLYDIWFGFPNRGNGDRLDNSDLLVLRLTSSITGSNIDPLDFDFWSTPAGGSGPFQAAAHVQNTPAIDGDDDSLWIRPGGTPVPDSGATLALLGIALTGLGFMGRRLRG